MSSVKVIVKGKARSRLALGVVAAYLRLHPNTTFRALKSVFPDTICPKAPVQLRSLVPLGVFQPLEVVQSLPEKGLAIAHYTANSELLNTADGVTIAVTKSWTQEAFEALSIAAAMYGIAIMPVPEGEKWASGTYELDFVDAHKPAPAPAAPPVEKPQPPSEPAQKPQASKCKMNCKPLYIIALLVLLGVAALMSRGSCSGMLGSKAVDTIIIDANDFEQAADKEQDKKSQSVETEVDSARQTSLAAQDTAPAPQAAAAAPRRKKVQRDSIAVGHRSPKAVAKRAASGKKKVQPVEKAAPEKKAEPKKRYTQKPLF